MERYHLRAKAQPSADPQTYGLGIKEVWEVSRGMQRGGVQGQGGTTVGVLRGAGAEAGELPWSCGGGVMPWQGALLQPVPLLFLFFLIPY